MNIDVVTAPPFEPISVAEAYEHLRWDTEEQGSPSETIYPLQTLIEGNITAARVYIETRTRRSLIEQTLRLNLPSFERPVQDAWAGFSGCLQIELPRPPLIVVESVKYYDEDNTLQTVSSANYFTTSGVVPALRFVDEFSVPCTYRRDDAVQITYQTGYAATDSPPTTQAEYAANVPKALKDAMKLTVQLLADRFDDTERAALERARDSILAHYIIPQF